MKTTTERYHEACENLEGVCTVCQEFVNEGLCEPDAEDYTCENCGGQTVFGAEQALMLELLEVEP